RSAGTTQARLTVAVRIHPEIVRAPRTLNRSIRRLAAATRLLAAAARAARAAATRRASAAASLRATGVFMGCSDFRGGCKYVRAAETSVGGFCPAVAMICRFPENR